MRHLKTGGEHFVLSAIPMISSLDTCMRLAFDIRIVTLHWFCVQLAISASMAFTHLTWQILQMTT